MFGNKHSKYDKFLKVFKDIEKNFIGTREDNDIKVLLDKIQEENLTYNYSVLQKQICISFYDTFISDQDILIKSQKEEIKKLRAKLKDFSYKCSSKVNSCRDFLIQLLATCKDKKTNEEIKTFLNLGNFQTENVRKLIMKNSNEDLPIKLKLFKGRDPIFEYYNDYNKNEFNKYNCNNYLSHSLSLPRLPKPARNTAKQIFTFLDYHYNNEKKLLNLIGGAVKPIIIKLAITGNLSLTKFNSLEEFEKISIQKNLSKFYVEFFDNLNDIVDKLNEDSEILVYLKYISTAGNLTPVQFYSLYELSRLFVSCGKIKSTSKLQTSMILSMYIFIKIIINYFIIHKGFLVKEQKEKGVDPHSEGNFRTFASILGYGIFYYFKDLPTIIQSKSMSEFVIRQNVWLDDESIEAIRVYQTKFIGYDPNDKDMNFIQYLKDFFYDEKYVLLYNKQINKNIDFNLQNEIAMLMEKLIWKVLNAKDIFPHLLKPNENQN